MHVVYFAQDLSDAAVARRVEMLRAGGADINLLGFRRSATPVREVAGIAAVDLGRTFDGRLASRALLVLRRALEAGQWRETVGRADILLARNLEMATIADAARGWAGSSARLVYECLDVHGALLGSGIPSMLLRRWEQRILGRSAALVVSSEGFLTHYFKTLDIDLPTTIIAENKRLLLEAPVLRPPVCLDRRPPWRIGWFGIIRCAESFQILADLARRRPALVEIEIRGRPTDELHQLITRHLPLPNMRFGGPYAPPDLSDIYQGCDFTWAVDYLQQGQNSQWLLPNRIYEGGFYNRPAIALAGTETASWLMQRKAGVILRNDVRKEIDSFFAGLTPARFSTLQRAAAAIPTGDLVYTVEDCRRLVASMAGCSLVVC